jgi:hypothetical protein
MSKIQISTRKIADRQRKRRRRKKKKAAAAQQRKMHSDDEIGQESFQGPSSFLSLVTSFWPLAMSSWLLPI